MKFLPLALIFFGCATTITTEEREWRDSIDRENWNMCEYVYQKAHKFTVHRNHSHRIHQKDPRWMIQDDLWDNHCKGVLGDNWIEY